MVSTVPPRTRRTSMPGPFPTAPWVPSAAHLATSQRQEGRCPYRRVHRDRHPPCLGLNGGPAFQHNEAFSFQVATDDQAETDRLWNAIVGVGDGAFEITTSASQVTVYFYKGGTFVSITLGAAATTAPPKDQVIALATTAASRV